MSLDIGLEYKKNVQGLQHYLANFVRNREVAQDLVQDTFEKAFRNRDQFAGGAEFSTWLYKIAKNVGIDYLRKKRELPFAQDDEIINPITPEEEMRGREIQSQLQLALTSYHNQNYVKTFHLNIQGYSDAEISTMQGIPPGTARARIHRMRKNIEKHLL